MALIAVVIAIILFHIKLCLNSEYREQLGPISLKQTFPLHWKIEREKKSESQPSVSSYKCKFTCSAVGILPESFLQSLRFIDGKWFYQFNAKVFAFYWQSDSEWSSQEKPGKAR